MEINKSKVNEDKEKFLNYLSIKKFKILNTIYKVLWWYILINILFLIFIISYKLSSPYIPELGQFSPDKVDKDDVISLVIGIVSFVSLNLIRNLLVKIYNRYVI